MNSWPAKQDQIKNCQPGEKFLNVWRQNFLVLKFKWGELDMSEHKAHCKGEGKRPEKKKQHVLAGFLNWWWYWKGDKVPAVP